MLESFVTALNVVLPITLMLLCGAMLRRSGVIKKELISSVNKLVFRLFLPAALFHTCYTSELKIDGNMKMVFFCCLSIFLVFLLYIPIIRKAEPAPSRRSVMLQGVFRGNLAMFGVPVLTLLYDKSNLGVMAILLAFMIPELNVLAVLCFEVLSNKKAEWKAVILRIVKNPLINAIFLGLIFNCLHIGMPTFVDKTIDSLSAVATPLTFVMLGANFSFASAKRNGRALTLILSGKLLILPLTALFLGISMGFRGPILASTIILFGSPVAVSSVPMTEEMGGDTDLASEGVIISTLLGVCTMFLWIFGMSYLGLL